MARIEATPDQVATAVGGVLAAVTAFAALSVTWWWFGGRLSRRLRRERRRAARSSQPHGSPGLICSSQAGGA